MSHIIELTSLAHPDAAVYGIRNEVQLRRMYEPDEGLFIAESPNVILRALHAGYVPVSILADKASLSGAAAEILECCPDIPVYTASDEVLTTLTGFHLTRGMLCAMRRRPMPAVTELCEGKKRIAVLEDVVNPTNVGAIFRSAAALHMDAVLLTQGCSDPLYRRAARVSMGTVFQIPWTYLPKGAYIPLLREMGFAAAAMALREDSVSVDDPALVREERLAVILGTEGEGLADETIAASDYTVMIPMSHGVDSLNVAAASAVAFWSLGRRTEHK